MAKWNSNYKFNGGAKSGFLWNSPKYILLLNVREFFVVEDNIEDMVATILSQERVKVIENILTNALFDNIPAEKFIIKDKGAVLRLIELTENIGIKDELLDLLVSAFIHEKVSVLEETKIFAELLEAESVKFAEITTVEALLKTLETAGLADLEASLKAEIALYDYLTMTDREPRTAISDFMIGAIEEQDRAYDWLIPFDLKIDWDNTKIQVMPEAELTKIQMPGIDGSIVQDSVYKDRLFEIVAFSEVGLTVNQKEELKTKITRILDATKHQDKTLTVQASDGSFDVRYEGKAEITDMPSYVKVKIPLRTPPYGYDAFANELEGSGLVYNINGDAPLRVTHYISGEISNPKFELGTIKYEWNGTVPNGSQLVINHELMTCYLMDEHGVKRNALSNLTGDFQAIPAGESVVLNADKSTTPKIRTEWRTKILW